MINSFLFKDINKTFFSWIGFISLQWKHRYISMSKNPCKIPCDITQLSNIWTNIKIGVTTDKLISNLVSLIIWKSLMTRSFLFKTKYIANSFHDDVFFFKLKEVFYNRRFFSTKITNIFHDTVISIQYKNKEVFRNPCHFIL